MKKIYNFIPGELINNIAIASRIYELIASIDFDKWIEVDERVYSLEFFQQYEEFYVMYLDPQGFVKKLYNTCRKDIIDFMKKRISYEYGEGVDIAICSKHFDNAVICNHDGQIFILKL